MVCLLYFQPSPNNVFNLLNLPFFLHDTIAVHFNCRDAKNATSQIPLGVLCIPYILSTVLHSFSIFPWVDVGFPSVCCDYCFEPAAEQGGEEQS